jgi:chromosome partitioning protein
MNVIVFASRKGGSGKSTLAAHLAAYAHKPSRPCLLIDTDPQGSLALWHKLRNDAELPLKATQRGVADIVKAAKRDGTEWVFIDTAPNMSAGVTDAIRAATLVVVPCRPGVFDLEAIKETVAFARQLRKPYAVVINGAAAPGGRRVADGDARARKFARAAHPGLGRSDHAARQLLACLGGRRGGQGIRRRLVCRR